MLAQWPETEPLAEAAAFALQEAELPAAPLEAGTLPELEGKLLQAAQRQLELLGDRNQPEVEQRYEAVAEIPEELQSSAAGQ